jgi:hypothetical protein
MSDYNVFRVGGRVDATIAGHEVSGRVCDVLAARDGSRSITVLLDNGWRTSVPECAVRTEAE